MQTLSEAIAKAGIDEKKAVAALKRSGRHLSKRDRPKFFASSVGKAAIMTNQQRRDRDALSWLTDTQRYVETWCRLNRLKA